MEEGNKKEDPHLYKEALCRNLKARPLAPWSDFNEISRGETHPDTFLVSGHKPEEGSAYEVRPRLQNILERIDDFIVHGNLVMKMRSG